MLISVEPGSRDDLLLELWEQGTAGIIEEERGVRAFFEHAVGLKAASASVIEIREEPDRPLVPIDRSAWDSLVVGDRWFIAPSWVAEPTPPGRTRLTIDCETAFGTGRHESTQLVLCALEHCVRPGMTVLDVGCGSGILSRAAQLLGAGRVLGCDLDEAASAAAACVNPGMVFQGSADAVIPGSADLVLANISTLAIDRIAAQLAGVVKADGVLILAGFLAERPPRSFIPDEESRLGDWLCWICRPGAARQESGDLETAAHGKDWWD
jgi:ribosomal protein L11 methyltransferase